MTKKDVKHARQRTIDMLRACFRHQHPEEFGREIVDEPYVPPELRYGNDPQKSKGRIIQEQAMGNPDAIPL